VARRNDRQSARFGQAFDALRQTRSVPPFRDRLAVDFCCGFRPCDGAWLAPCGIVRSTLVLPSLLAVATLLSCGPSADPSLDPIAQAITVHNPVQKNCADPSVMKDGAAWYLTCTGGQGSKHFPIYRSTDLLHWTHVGWVFTAATTPAWAHGDFWAPELHHVPGGIAVYFSALDHGRHVLGVAKAAAPLGPYHARGVPLLARSHSLIDAHVLAVGAKRWLYWKAEGSPDSIWVRRLDASGMKLSASSHARKILVADRAWEKNVVEGPWVQRHGGWYYLFYSGGVYCNASYAVGVARSRSPAGPFRKRAAGPILKSGSRWVGPGHNSIARGPDGNLYLVYHAYHLTEGTPVCGTGAHDNNHRHTLIDRLRYVHGWPRVSANL
jgi:arabinan endo-1,5-alpha-L-arabinosidase